MLVGRRSSPYLKVDLYDPTTGMFSMVRTSPTGGKAVTLADGRVLLSSGAAMVLIFDPGHGQGAPRPGSWSGSESGMTATRLLLDGRVLVVVDVHGRVSRPTITVRSCSTPPHSRDDPATCSPDGSSIVFGCGAGASAG